MPDGQPVVGMGRIRAEGSDGVEEFVGGRVVEGELSDVLLRALPMKPPITPAMMAMSRS